MSKNPKRIPIKKTPEREEGPQGRKITKNEIHLRIELTPEQETAKKIMLNNDVTILTGKPGTSKTTLNCYVALQLLLTRRVGKIIVTRPMVDVGKKSMGFLPGDAFDFKEGKMAPYLAPVLQAFYKLYQKEQIDKYIEQGIIEIIPIQFVRGSNFEDCVVMVDEAQNLDAEELKALTTRLCKDAKMLFTSDLNQVDLLNKRSSAGKFFKAIEELDGVAMFELTENFRSPLALAIMDKVDEQLEAERKAEY